MSEDRAAAGTTRLLMIGVAVASIVGLLLALLSLFLILDMRADTATLVEQSRKSAKNLKALQEQVETMSATVQSVAHPEPAAPAPVHMDAADTRNDCVIRPGDDRNGLVDCLGGPPAESPASRRP